MLSIGILIGTPCSSSISSSRKSMAALNAVSPAPSVLPVSSEIWTTLAIVSGVRPTPSKIALPLRVITE